MKQNHMVVPDMWEMNVGKINSLNPTWIYTNWESQKVLGCVPLSPYDNHSEENSIFTIFIS